MDLGRALRYYREMKKCTQWELASKAGVNEKYYGKVERNESSPTIYRLELICKGLNIEVSTLIKKAEEFSYDKNYGQ